MKLLNALRQALVKPAPPVFVRVTGAELDGLNRAGQYPEYIDVHMKQISFTTVSVFFTPGAAEFVVAEQAGNRAELLLEPVR